jgi:hypothetical protein
VIFVHGTGVREKQYNSTFIAIKQGLQNLNPNIELISCSWGKHSGARLNANNASSPNFDPEIVRNISGDLVEIYLWDELYRDPTAEIQFLPHRRREGSHREAPRKLRQRIESLLQQDFLNDFDLRFSIDHYTFQQAHSYIFEYVSIDSLCAVAQSPLNEFYDVISRAIVGALVYRSSENPSSDKSEEQARFISNHMHGGEVPRGSLERLAEGFIKKIVVPKAVKKLQEDMVKRNPSYFPAIADILMYQARPDPIHDYILDVINRCPQPVFLLAHSLGGIACVDLLISNKQASKSTKALITVGSQVPFMYEINALRSLEYKDPLPSYFPSKWVNIYDKKDSLSFVGQDKNLFSNYIEDYEVNNEKHFPECHSRYWGNTRVYEKIVEVIENT